VGWKLEDHEKSEHAIKMWKEALENQQITGKGLTNHKDNGSIMRSDEMIKFVTDAQMIDSYSRAGVSDDNPFSESLFGTIKTFRTFPGSFVSLDEGRKYFGQYFHDYCYFYKHSRIQFITPAERHYGDEEKILNKRNQSINDFYQNNSHRYSKGAKTFYSIAVVNIN
jgi:transposase InsO family protein